MDEITAKEDVAAPAKPRRQRVSSPELARRLKEYYQLECVRPTSDRIQVLLDQFLRKAGVSAELDHRAQSRGGH